jgi:FkbM family methyltransferase
LATLAKLDELLGEVGDHQAGGTPGRDTLAPSNQPLILFGAGHLGRTMLAGLRKIGIEPAAFADDTPSKSGTMLDGVCVLAPEDAASRFGRDSAWVVTILNPEHRYLQSRHRLRQMGCRRISSFLHLAWQHPEILLPYYQFDLPDNILRNSSRIREAFQLLADDESRQQFIAHLRFRLRLDYDALPPTAESPYFPQAIVLPLPDDVVFVDCGAYTGDTVCRFLEVQGNTFKSVIAIEPDRTNFEELTRFVKSLDPGVANRIGVHQLALGEHEGTARFNGLGNMSAAVSASGSERVTIMPLDRLLPRERNMYIKFDIEGAELDALKGSGKLLTDCAPLLAVCVYHRPDDLWDIPLFIHSVNPDYRFFLTTEGTDGMDVVCYAVPRAKGPSAECGVRSADCEVRTAARVMRNAVSKTDLTTPHSALRTPHSVLVKRYDASLKARWDDFVARSKNGVFMFHRDYLEYHADRFADHSLLFTVDDKLVAVLPANVSEGTLSSHGGLTFGGFVTDARMRTPLMLDLFAALKEYLRAEGIGRFRYKTVPHIYHQIPAEEDLYALFVHNARLARRDVSSTIRMADRPALTKGRKWSAKRARTNGVEVRRSHDVVRFMVIETDHLQTKYGVKPTHTAAEIELLAGRFPDNIKLFGAFKCDAMLGGVLVYESAQVAHAQYIAATAEGKELAALDAILDVLLEETYVDKPYFDFGISTEQNGRYLNVGLVNNKESYGARAIAYDHYELEIAG